MHKVYQLSTRYRINSTSPHFALRIYRYSNIFCVSPKEENSACRNLIPTHIMTHRLMKFILVAGSVARFKLHGWKREQVQIFVALVGRQLAHIYTRCAFVSFDILWPITTILDWSKAGVQRQALGEIWSWYYCRYRRKVSLYTPTGAFCPSSHFPPWTVVYTSFSLLVRSWYYSILHREKHASYKNIKFVANASDQN